MLELRKRRTMEICNRVRHCVPELFKAANAEGLGTRGLVVISIKEQRQMLSKCNWVFQETVGQTPTNFRSLALPEKHFGPQKTAGLVLSLIWVSKREQGRDSVSRHKLVQTLSHEPELEQMPLHCQKRCRKSRGRCSFISIACVCL